MKAWAYYNEFDSFAAGRLREHIAHGRIAPGFVDERSIEDVRPEDLRGFTQIHLFAGIGVWSYALRLAGWRDDRPVWTASCPCQPFSAAGKGGGFDDERHLWPAAHWLIGQHRPLVVFGEQSASKDGANWLDLVQSDMEAMGYAFGAVAFPSASVGAPHIRDRAYWVADANRERWTGSESLRTPGRGESPDGGAAGGLADANRKQCEIANPGCRENTEAEGGRQAAESTGYCTAGGLADSGSIGLERRVHGRQDPQREVINGSAGCDCSACRPGPVNGFWRDADWLGCRDGKWRAVKPGLTPLANGATHRMGRIRTYGNAINAYAAKAFIESFMENER